MPKKISIALCVAFFVGIFFFIQHSVERELDRLVQWPESVKNNNYFYCKPNITRECRDGEWIGFLDSELPKFSKGTHPQSIFDVRHIYCVPIGDPPSSQIYRIIKIDDSDILYLCILDQEKNILERAAKAIEAAKT